MRRSPPKSTIEDLPRPVFPEPNAAFRSPAPAVQCWRGLVQRMNRKTLDRFTKDIWLRFDEMEFERGLLLRPCVAHSDDL